MKKTLIAAISLVIPAVLFAEPGEKKDMTGVWEVSISPTGVRLHLSELCRCFSRMVVSLRPSIVVFHLLLLYRQLRLIWARHMANGSKRVTESSS